MKTRENRQEKRKKTPFQLARSRHRSTPFKKLLQNELHYSLSHGFSADSHHGFSPSCLGVE
jgi:hypothetical protein